MKINSCILIIGCLLPGLSASSTVRYVNVSNATPIAPYTNWATAANVIQEAIEVADAGDEVLVTNGVYETGGHAVYPGMTNRVAVTKPLTLCSVNGPEVTVIRGYQVPGTTNGDGAVRCVYLTNGATLVGFTRTNGAVLRSDYNPTWHEAHSGGGVFCASADAAISNCVITGNSAAWGGGAFWGSLVECTLGFNTARAGGGAVRSIMNRCVLKNNLAGSGGGAINATLTQCTIAENEAHWGGGVSHSGLNQCEVSRNVGSGASSSSLTNCLVIGNTSNYGAVNSSLWNCVIVSNLVGVHSDVWFWGLSPPVFGCDSIGCYPAPECGLCPQANSFVVNCIIYDNAEADHVGFTGAGITSEGVFFLGGEITYSCTTPLPTNGIGNITNAPRFVDAAAGNFRLQSNSPCINAGRNSNAPSGFDLDGNSRIVGGTVDIGAYEFQSPQSALSYAWLQQYGFPTDGSVDLADPDADGHNNWQEWRAWTDPTNSASALRVLWPIADTNGLVIQWQSVSGQRYFLERSTNLIAPPKFSALASNIMGAVGTTAYADTNAPPGPKFYRIGVHE